MEGKYVMINYNTPILFNSVLEHKQFNKIGVNITSAGFFYATKSDGVVYGRSQTLKINSKAEDKMWIDILIKPEF